MGKGAKLKAAAAAGCQPGYLSQVLNGTAHLSAEQADQLAQFLGLSASSHEYFLTLVQYDRAGTTSLRKFYERRLQELKEANAVLKNRLSVQNVLSIEDQTQFYSSWHYGAIHVAVSIPALQNESALASYFDLPLKRVNEIVEFLLRIGLIKREEDNRLNVGQMQIFIGSDSPLISKHHTNWRLQAIRSLDRYTERDLHYSSVMAASYKDVARIREIMVKTIDEIRGIIRESKEEACFSYAFDLFQL